jgi:hypothetical protein
LPFLLYHHVGLELDDWFLKSLTISWPVFSVSLAITALLGVAVAVVPLAIALRRIDLRQLS